jgi:hypothetical protein
MRVNEMVGKLLWAFKGCGAGWMLAVEIKLEFFQMIFNMGVPLWW